MATTRRAFDPDAEDTGGDLPPANSRPEYVCFAGGCPMPGTLFTAGTDKAGTCAWHYGAQPSDIPRITRILRDWECVTFEIRAARAVLAGPHASDPKVLFERFAEAVERLRPAVKSGGWGDRFERHGSEDYRRWANRLEHFLGKRITESLGQRAAA